MPRLTATAMACALMAVTAAPATAQSTADLTICLDSYHAGQAKYTATVLGKVEGDHLLLGARDTSAVVWVQKSADRISADRNVQNVGFTVASVSSYPLQFAVFALSEAAYAAYDEACTSAGDCYFAEDASGIERRTPFADVRSVAEAIPC